MLLNKPRLPTMTMILGLEISGGEMTRPRASSAIDMQRATRNTPLMSAPRISARCHPYEFAAEEGDRASLIVYSATIRERTSLSSQLVCWVCTWLNITDLSIWNESATKAKEPTAYPAMSS